MTWSNELLCTDKFHPLHKRQLGISSLGFQIFITRMKRWRVVLTMRGKLHYCSSASSATPNVQKNLVSKKKVIFSKKLLSQHSFPWRIFLNKKSCNSIITFQTFSYSVKNSEFLQIISHPLMNVNPPWEGLMMMNDDLSCAASGRLSFMWGWQNARCANYAAVSIDGNRVCKYWIQLAGLRRGFWEIHTLWWS